jgi:hypothetical protein
MESQAIYRFIPKEDTYEDVSDTGGSATDKLAGGRSTLSGHNTKLC